jgi:hypothetical protein
MKPVRLAIRKLEPRGAPSARGAVAASADETPADLVPAGVGSLQFGDHVVYCGGSKAWADFRERATRARASVAEHPDAVDGKRLHVVVQKGRLFQQEYPDVPVLLDKGRYLLVDLAPSRARRMGKGDIPCFTVRPLDAVKPTKARGRHRVVFTAAARAPGVTSDPAIKALVDRVARATYEADLDRLVAFGTRHSLSPQYRAACDFVDQRLAGLGYETSRQAIKVDGKASQNVVASRKGSGPGTRGIVVVSAHLDSINLEGNAASPAPGADGSGSAGVIEIARALKDHQGRHDLTLILFGGEEEGLFGSKQYVAALTSAARARIRAVVHMDMIASLNTPQATVLLEGAPLSQGVIDGLAAAATTYTQLGVQTSLDPHNSDHVPFITKKVPAVLTIEGTDDANHAIHSPRDTLDRINFDLALEILRMNTAFVAQTLDR